MTASSSRSPRRSASERASGTEALDTPAPAVSATRCGWQGVWGVLRGPYPTLLSRGVVGGVFLLAGISKALNTGAFAAEISAYQLVPAPLVPPMALALPWLEIVLAAYLLLGLAQRWAATAAGALLLVFIGAMAATLVRGLTLECGCFGNVLGVSLVRDTVSVGSIVRDLIWLVLCVHLLIVPGVWSLDTLRGRRARMS